MLKDVEILITLANFDGYESLEIEDVPYGLTFFHMKKKRKTLNDLTINIAMGRNSYNIIEGPDYIYNLNHVFRLQNKLEPHQWESFVNYLDLTIHIDSLSNTANPTGHKLYCANVNAPCKMRATGIFLILQEAIRNQNE